MVNSFACASDDSFSQILKDLLFWSNYIISLFLVDYFHLYYIMTAVDDNMSGTVKFHEFITKILKIWPMP